MHFVYFVGKLFSQVIYHKIDQHIDLAFGQHIAEWDHAVAAVGDVVVDLVGSLVFMLAVADIGYHAAVVERFALRLRPVTNSTVLAKEGCFERFAVLYRITLRF